MRQLVVFYLAMTYCVFAFPKTLIKITEADQEKINEYLELVDYYEEIDNIHQAVFYLNKIAFIYWENENVSEAIKYFLASVPMNEKIGQYNDIKVIYSNIALMYTDLDELVKAKDFFRKSLEISKKFGSKKEIASGLYDEANITSVLRKYKESNQLLGEALSISLEIEHPSLIINCYSLIAENYYNDGDVRKGKEFADKLERFRQHIVEERVKREYQERERQNLLEIEKTKSELEAEKLAKEMGQAKSKAQRDSLARIVKLKADSLLLVKKKDSLAQEEIKILERKRLAIEKEQKAKQERTNLILLFFSVGLILLVVIALIVYRSFKYQQKTNIELEVKNKEINTKSKQLEIAYKQIELQNLNITKSINYAKGIQKALLPKQEMLNTYIPESFIIFKPRDIVSGDFYWFSEIDGKQDLFESKNEYRSRKNGEIYKNFEFLPVENNKFAIAAVDCTGHGVPGAFMCMIGYNLLNEILDNGITRADLILKELHKGIRKTLKQDISENRDGMDIALCVINKLDRTVNYAGAENPVIYIQDGEVYQRDGTRYSIGGIQNEKKRVFNGYTIKVDKPTRFYIFSDGFSDQFGGKDGNKFLICNLRKLLLEIHQKPMLEQKKILEQAFVDWKGSRKQIDDVLMIGFKLG